MTSNILTRKGGLGERREGHNTRHGGQGASSQRTHPALVGEDGRGPDLRGHVVERAGVFMGASDESGEMLSGLLGLSLAVLGCLTLVLGTMQFLRNRRRISRGEFVPGATIYLVVTAGGLALGGCFVFYAGYLLSSH